MEKNSKRKIKTILLLLSIFPYLIFLVMGIFNLCYDSINNGYLDLYALFEPLTNVWHEIIGNLNIIFIILAIFCVGYPIYYLLDKSSKKKDNTLEASPKPKKINKLFVLYIISFLPYLYLIYSCIFGIELGFFSSTSTYYGFTAIIIAFVSLSIVPIYPILLIFQIIYTIKKYKIFSDIQRKVLKVTIIILLLLLIVPSIIHLINSKNNLNTTYNQDKIIIENYLKDEFGEKYYNNMEIIKPSRISTNYEIKTPLLKETFELSLNEKRTKITSNSFYEDFIDENDLNDKLSNYLNQYYKFPEYLELNSSIDKFDIKDSNNIDNLLKNCSYKIDSFNITKEDYNKEEIIKIIKDYFINYDQILTTYYDKSYLMFNAKVNNKSYASIQTIKDKYEAGSIKLIFSGYNYGDDYTIPNEELTINIYKENDTYSQK